MTGWLHLDAALCVLQAAEELRLTNDKFNKLVTAASKNAADKEIADPEKAKVDATLKDALKIVRVAQSRIEQRIGLLDNRYQSDCMVVD